MSVKHKRLSLLADTADPSLIHPSDWNDDHVIDSLDVVLASGGSVLDGAPMRIVVNQDVFGAGNVIRWENTSIAPGAAIAVDFLCGSVLGNDYVYGRWMVVSPHSAAFGQPAVAIGSSSNHDFIIQTANAPVMRFNRTTVPAAGPYLVSLGDLQATFPALKRDTIFFQLRKGDDSGVSGAPTASLPAAAAARDGIIGFDTTLNALVYYVGGSRFKLAGVSF